MNKCKGCEWHNKPYWSIINPCEHCTREEIQTFTRWIDPSIDKMKREIEIKNRYMQMIVDLGIDYDGCNTIESLKSLIDELIRLARLGIENNDKEYIYTSGNNETLNILFEKVDKIEK
jgi:hypothetical protein